MFNPEKGKTSLLTLDFPDGSEDSRFIIAATTLGYGDDPKALPPPEVSGFFRGEFLWVPEGFMEGSKIGLLVPPPGLVKNGETAASPLVPIPEKICRNDELLLMRLLVEIKNTVAGCEVFMRLPAKFRDPKILMGFGFFPGKPPIGLFEGTRIYTSLWSALSCGGVYIAVDDRGEREFLVMDRQKQREFLREIAPI